VPYSALIQEAERAVAEMRISSLEPFNLSCHAPLLNRDNMLKVTCV
jgi:hypothetical protein